MPATSLFDAETAVLPDGEHRWLAHVSPEYNIGDNPNGGYLVAIATAAMAKSSPHPDPITITTHFLRPGTAGAPAEVTTELIRSGRTVTTMRAILSQGGKQRLEVLAAFGDLSASTETVFTTPPPVLPPVEDCKLRSGVEQGVDLPILNRVNIQVPPHLSVAGQSEVALIEGWIRFSDDREPDTHALTLFADAFPPPLFTALGYVGWVPTIELTVHVRRRPAPGWMMGQFGVHDLTDGRFVEDGMLWDSTGVLVAQSRQLGMLLTPPG